MNRGSRRGFTLVEVLVAIGIVGFGLLSLLTLLPVGLRSTRLAGDFTTAAFLGRQELEELRSRAQIRDFIDDNLNGAVDATDGNGVQDAGEPFESGFFLWELNPAAIPIAVNTQPPAGPLQARTQRDNDGLGYFDLGLSLKKGRITSFRVLDSQAVVPQTYIIRIVVDDNLDQAPAAAGGGQDFVTGGITNADFVVIGRNQAGNLRVLEGRFDEPFPLPGDPLGEDLNIAFTLEENLSPVFDEGADGLDNDGNGNPAAASCAVDPNCDAFDGTADATVNGDVAEGSNDRFFTGETIEIHLVTVENAWYAYWIMRYDYSEDRELPERDIGVDGMLTDVDPNTGGVQTVEDTGLDLVPNFFDENFDGVQAPTESPGETGFRTNTFDDPHGDDGLAVDNDTVPDGLFNEDPLDGTDNDYDGVIDEDPAEWDPLTGRGTENDGIVNALPENEIQRVTVTVVWREGGLNREARFSTYIANPYL